jgi:AcrR family transcriptional regulator
MKLKDAEKREAINAKIVDIVYEKGIAGIKMLDLACKVGICSSTLYVYYRSKEDLIVSVFTDLVKEHTEQFRSNLALDIPFKLKLKKIWLQWLHFSVNNFKEMNFIQQVKQSPYMDKLSREIKDDKVQLNADLLAEGKRQQLIKEVPDVVLISLVEANLKQTTELILEKQLALNEKDMDMMFTFLWDAIKR